MSYTGVFYCNLANIEIMATIETVAIIEIEDILFVI